MEQQSNGYTVELDKAGDELITAYWVADTLEQAQSILETLKRACTAYDVTLTITDDHHQIIEIWKLGDELKPAVRLHTKKRNKS